MDTLQFPALITKSIFRKILIFLILNLHRMKWNKLLLWIKMSAWAIGKGDTMKRFLIFILSSIMVLALTACGNSSSAEIVSEGETRTSNNKDIQTEPAVPANSTQQNTLQADDTAQSEKIEGGSNMLVALFFSWRWAVRCWCSRGRKHQHYRSHDCGVNRSRFIWNQTGNTISDHLSGASGCIPTVNGRQFPPENCWHGGQYG